LAVFCVSSQFGATASAGWNDLGLTNINAKVTFSPHSANNAVLASIASDIDEHVTSSLFFSLAFLYQTQGAVRDAVTKVTANSNLFVYGISDKRVGGMDLLKPDGNLAPVFPSALKKNVPEPFKSEVTGGGGTRMHHKFVVIDFDKPTARVYLGSYNFSKAADNTNGENLLLIKDRKIAVSYTIEALRIFDHYHFRVAQNEAKQARKNWNWPNHRG
jgi:phosphatidylserine/phosphatidylglycerophosphate/cardiolipin synthase-like enzyme